MAAPGFRSGTRRELQPSDGAPRRTTSSSFSDSSSRFFSDAASAIEHPIFQDASSQRDSDQDSFCPDDSGSLNPRHLTSDSESESSSIIDRFRQTSIRNESSASIPRFQQSTISARGRQRTIEPNQRRSFSREPAGRRSESEEPGLRRSGRSESLEPGYRRSESREPGFRRSESREPGYRRSESREPIYRRSESREPIYRRSESREAGYHRSESKEPAGRTRRSESQEPGGFNVNRFSLSSRDEFPEPHQRGRSAQRGEIVFTRSRRSESQEPRGRSNSKDPVPRRSESQGPGVRLGVLKQLDDSQLQMPVEALESHPASDVQAEERTITAVHAQLKANNPPPSGEFDNENLYGAMRAEVRKAVADLKTEIEKSLEKDMLTLVKTKGEISEAEVRKHYAEKLEQSESRTHELLSQLAKEEGTRHELAKLVTSPSKKPESKKPEQHLNKPEQKPIKPEPRLRTRPDHAEKRRTISKALDEEAQKYFEDFASISTSESEEPVRRRSKTSPKVSPNRNPVRKKSPPKAQVNQGSSSRNEGPSRCRSGASVAVNTDGVVTPWLDWETDSADDTLAEINWDSVDALISSFPADDRCIRECEELPVQRLRFRERLEAGRVHLCRGEF